MICTYLAESGFDMYNRGIYGMRKYSGTPLKMEDRDNRKRDVKGNPNHHSTKMRLMYRAGREFKRELKDLLIRLDEQAAFFED
ncbi:MAG: hypothetical protein AABX48_04335 [Nanoarchaeota archaeon]